MADQWFYRMFGDEFGPVPFENLKELAQSGTIQAMDEVRCESSPDWVAAATVDELGLLSFNTAATADVTSSTEVEMPGSQAANDEWYCSIGGQELGPLTFDELLSYAENEQISADDEVKLGVQGHWRRVGSIGRLMAALPYRAIEKTIVPTAPKPHHDESIPVDPPGESAAADADDPSPQVEAAPSSPAARPKSSKPDPSTGKRAARRRSKSAEPSPADWEPDWLSAPATPVAPVAGRTWAKPEPVAEPEPEPAAPAYAAVPVSESPAYGDDVATGDSNSMEASQLEIPSRPVSRYSVPESQWLSDLLETVKQPQTLGWMAGIAVVLLFVGWGYLPKSRAADIKRYHTLRGLLDEIKACRRNSPGDLAPLQKRLEAVGKQITAEIKDSANRDDPAKQSLLWAARDEVPRCLNAGLEKESKSERHLADRLQEVAYALGLERPPPIVSAPKIATHNDNE